MKHVNSFKIRWVTLVILIPANSFGQTEYSKIATFTKVWGFLKYHHPAVATGQINWDSVYVNNLPKIQYTATINEFNNILLSVIDDLGEIQKTQSAKLPDSVFTQNHDLKWIDHDQLIHKSLRSRLKDIYTYRNQGDNKYIKTNYLTADYSGENKYNSMGFPDQDYRLLFLARFWNAINYFAPYKYEIGEDWGNMLTRFIPQMMNLKDTLSYYQILLQLSVSLNDGHSQFTIDNDNAPINDLVFGKYTAPVYSAILDGQVIINKLADDSLSKSALQKGDLVLSVDNEPISQRITRIRSYLSASNNNSRNKHLTWVLFDTHNNYQTLKIKRGDEILTLKVKCMLAAKRDWRYLTNYTYNDKGYKKVGNSIAYVYAAQIWHGNLDTIKALIKKSKAVIFDVRNYPNNDDFYNIFDIFLPEPKVINQSLCMSINNPGFFKWKPSPRIGNINRSPYRGTVIILADERSQSQGEYSTMCLQTIPNSITIGSQTAGADGVVTQIPMGGKLAISYSGYGIFYPDKTPTQRRGIKIDIPVKKTIKSVMRDDDLAVEEALKLLKKKGIN
jgi:C-terminal processing protease CtpA/Prc